MKRTPIHVHFVCTGNIYRSRLAEAYLRSKNLTHIMVSSSGTQANIQHKGPILWTTLRLLYRNNLLPYTTDKWRQITSNQLRKADVVVFIGKKNYEYCRQRFPIPEKFEVWNFPDFDDRDMNGKPLDIKREIECVTLSENTFLMVKGKVDSLVTAYKLDSRNK